MRNDLFESMLTYEATKRNECACWHLMTAQVQPMQPSMQQQCMTLHMMMEVLGCKANCNDCNRSRNIIQSFDFRLALRLSAGWVNDESVVVPACTHVQLITIE